MRRGVPAALVVAAALAATAAGAPRIHRTVLPPPPALPDHIAVDETEWSVRPSARAVASGAIRIQVYNRGMDDHDLAVVDAAGVRRSVALPAGESASLEVVLAPGRHRIWCTLFEGTTQSHAGLGMEAYLEARPAVRPARAAARVTRRATPPARGRRASRRA